MQRKIEFGPAHWLDIEQPTAEELNNLGKIYGIPADLIEDCLSPDHLPKFSRTPSGGFVIVRAYDQDATDSVTDVGAATRKVAVFWGEHFFITIHRSRLSWFEELWTDWSLKDQRSPFDLSTTLYEIIGEALFTFEAPIDRATVAIDNLEDAIFQESNASASSHVLSTAFLAKKRATLFKRMLRLTRDILPSITKLGDPSSPAVQSLKEEIERLFYYADDLVETASDLVQLSITLSSSRTNNLVRLLTIVSIFLLPLNLITGVYGMNFTFMPEIQQVWGYPAALGLMFAIETGIFLWLRRRKWLT
jgi:magnesium transporter